MKRISTFIALASLAVQAWSADPAMVRMLMPDAKVIGGVDLTRLKSSPFGQILLAQIPRNDKQFDEMIATLGFDPRRDLKEVLFATSGSLEVKDSMLALISGTFDVTRAGTLTALGSLSAQNYKGVTILVPKDTSESLAFLDSSTLAVGSPQLIQAAIDRRSAVGAPAPSLATKIAEVSGTYDAWLISALPVAELTEGVSVPDRNVSGALKGDLLKSIESVQAGVRFGSKVEVTAQATARSEKDATALADVARFLVAMVQLNAPKSGRGEAFQAVAQTMQVEAASSVVKITFSIPHAEVEKLFAPKKAPAAKI